MAAKHVRDALEAWEKGGGGLAELPGSPKISRRDYEREIKRSALHEAGHIVTALAVGFVITKAYIGDPRTTQRGFVTAWSVENARLNDGDAVPFDPVLYGLIAWGGTTAEGKAPWIYGEDAMALAWLEKNFCFTRHAILLLRDECARILKKHRRAVVAVANVLETALVIGPRHARRIAVAASPSLAKLVSPVPRGFPNPVKLRAYYARGNMPPWMAEV